MKLAKLTVELPHVGESVTEAVIGKWLVSPGDAIRKYDPLVEVITDKVNMDVPAPADGKLVDTLVDEGETVEMGAPIAEMEVETAAETSREDVATVQSANRIGTMITGANVGPTGGEFQDTSLDAEAIATDPPAEPSRARPDARRGSRRARGRRYSPVVKRLAESHEIDLSEVQGSGRGGRVTKRDIEAHISSLSAPPAAPADELLQPSPVRKTIADNMARSFREIPHAWGAIEVDATRLAACRNEMIDEVEAATGRRLTYLPIILRFVAEALKVHRRLNSSWTEDGIILKGAVNIGLAVAADHGLVVPVIKGADKLTLNETVGEMARLVDAARSNRLRLDDVHDGTFTLNNTGALGSVWGGAIINYPQAAILTTESIVKRPVAVQTSDGQDAIVVRSMMNLCLSFDHRIVDGAEAMAFLRHVKQSLESVERDSI